MTRLFRETLELENDKLPEDTKGVSGIVYSTTHGRADHKLSLEIDVRTPGYDVHEIPTFETFAFELDRAAVLRLKSLINVTLNDGIISPTTVNGFPIR